MKKTAALIFVAIYAISGKSYAQNFNQLTDDGTYTESRTFSGRRDTIKNKDKEIPVGIKVWTVDERFGDRMASSPDTLSHMFMNTIFTTGTRGEYNTTGNLGAPRINRIFADRPVSEQFIFTQPYDYFVQPVSSFLFTNTLSPITNITYDECGDRSNGEDHLKALFGTNIGKKFGVGFKFDYIYGRGYYQNQSTSHFNYTMYGSYIGERYNAHLLLSTNHQKVTENGGITDDRYITHPEVFDDDFNEDEIPTVLEQNWNRNDNQHVFFSHRYSVGFHRKVKMTKDEIEARKFAIESQKENERIQQEEEARKKAKREGTDFNEDNFENGRKIIAGRPTDSKVISEEPEPAAASKKGNRISISSAAMADSLSRHTAQDGKDTAWMKTEYVPVTSFIHTLKFDNYRRIYQAYSTPTDFYADTYDMDERLGGDSVYDKTKSYSLKNTFAVALLEGFNKWAKAGIKIFATSELRHFTIPASNSGIVSYNEHNISIGGQISKYAGKAFHYNAIAETWLTGEDAGQIKIDANANLKFKFGGDSILLAAKAYFYRLTPTFYYRHFHAKHLWWDNDLKEEIRSRVEGNLSFRKTGTIIRVAVDDIKNYTYFAQKYTITSTYGRTGNSVSVKQSTGNINLITLQLEQNFNLGPAHWENMITYQKSTNGEALSVPMFNVYTNLYIRFKIARVLKVDFGADARYFTKYTAPDYSPALGQYTVQDNEDQNIKTGNYPIINIYANMHLKQTRFFIMMSHVNASTGNYFLTPHYPVNSRVIRFGLSWNFFN